MTTTTIDLWELAIHVPCASCGASPYEECRTARGATTTPHAPRTNPIHQAYAHGYLEAALERVGSR